MLGPHGWEPSTPYSRGSAGGSMPRARKSFRIQSAPIQAVAEEGTCRQSQSMVPGFARTFQVQGGRKLRSEEHTSELQSLMRISYDVFCLKKKNITINLRKQ